MSWDIEGFDKWTYDEIPLGAMTLEGGTGTKHLTGDWRVKRPVWDSEKCINCLQCWMFCPDNSCMAKDEKMVGVDYEHCKGCGVCAQVCPVNALTMHTEKDIRAKGDEKERHEQAEKVLNAEEGK